MMMEVIQKDRIARSFSKGRATYNKNAIVQREIVDRLVNLTLQHGGFQDKKILEIGCGTGFLTRGILSAGTPDLFFINDLDMSAFTYIEEILTDCEFSNYKLIGGDAEITDFPHGLDMIISSSTFQWFSYLQNFINRSSRLLRSGGIFAFSTFGKENYMELKKVAGIGLDYFSLGEIEYMLTENYNILTTVEYIRQLNFQGSFEALQHIKKSGTNGLSTSCLKPGELRKIMGNYDQMFSNKTGGVKLTYHPIMIIAQKK